MQNQNTFNVVHAAVALLCVVVIVTIAVVVSHASKRTSNPYRPAMQLRGIHQGMVTYANSNKDYFPGLGHDGLEDTSQVPNWRDSTIPPIQAGLAVEQRFAILLYGDYMTPEYLISPSESEPVIKYWPGEGAFTKGHYSYAMLQVPKAGGRYDEWSQNLNTQGIVLSDRNTGTRDNPSSIHTDPGEPWSGSVLWNDNHVSFEMDDQLETKYGAGVLNPEDRLFESSGKDDALMVHTGN